MSDHAKIAELRGIIAHLSAVLSAELSVLEDPQGDRVDEWSILMTARPCPFCGAEQAEPQFGIRFVGTTAFTEKCVWCPSCGQRGPWVDEDEDALAKWNTRPIEDALIEALEAIKDSDWNGDRSDIALITEAIDAAKGGRS